MTLEEMISRWEQMRNDVERHLDRGCMVNLRWVLTRDTFPALAKRTRHLYVAFDGETSVGRVYSIEAGQQTRRWEWCVTAVRCHVDPAVPMTGEMPSREEAKHCVDEAYAETMRWASRS